MRTTVFATLAAAVIAGAGCTNDTEDAAAELLAASIVADHDRGEAPLSVRFEAQTIGAVTLLEWDFGDGSPIETGTVVTHTYTAAGTYTVVLIAREESGPGDNTSVAITVTDPPESCPSCVSPQSVGRVEDTRILECSGLVRSRTQAVLWLHNDSGDGPRVFAITEDGTLRAVVTLQGTVARDWEDMARGPWSGGGDALYLADIGDNAHSRSSVRIHRVPEPVLDLGGGPAEFQTADYESFDLVYPDGARDAETLLVDPDTGDVYIVSKESSGASGVYFAAAPADGSVTTLSKVASVTFGTGALPGSPLATAGDVSPDGRRILIRTYSRAFVFRRPPGGALWEAFGAEPCAVPSASEAQGESIAFAADGFGFYTISEGTRPLVYLTACSSSADP